MINVTAVDVQAARTELARRSVVDYAQMIDIPTAPVSDRDDEDIFQTIHVGRLAAHHRLLLEALQDVADGVTPNLMVFMPPGTAKSSYVDVVFVPWFMSRGDKQSVILASYGSDLARKQGRRARQLVKSSQHKSLFNITLSAESSAADEWSLSNGSEYMAGGILSGLTGNRSDLGIIDDPVKGRAEAESDTISEKTWDAYKDDFCTRLKPGGRQIIIQTRWAENDLAGRILPIGWDGESGLLDGRDGRKWRVLCIPAQCDRDDDPLGRRIGEFIWPEWFKSSDWAPLVGDKTPSGRRRWSSLYQQKPTPQDGFFFKREWFRRYAVGQYPLKMTYYISSDHAPGGGEANDYTCVRVWGVDDEGDLWLVNGHRSQETMDETAIKLLSYINRYNPSYWFPEDDNNYKAASGFIWRMMMEQRQSVVVHPISPHGSDKEAKATAFQGMAAMGRVWIPEGPEGDDIIDQYLKFPNGANDDEVDAAGVMGRALRMVKPAQNPSPEDKTPEWMRSLTKKRKGSWKVS